MITLRQMRYFEALANTLHFGRAAQLVNVSQPALSTQIAEMERQLGVLLVERTRNGIYLTREGEAILPEIATILEAVNRLHLNVQQFQGMLEGRLRLGIIPTVAPYMVPVFIPMVREKYPSLDMELKELLTSACVEDLRLGKLDCAIVALPVEGEGFMSRLLFEDRFMIASAANEADILMSPLTQDTMDIERLLLLEEGHCLRDQALAVCGTSAGRRVANYGATSMATLLQMVSHGMGITLIPEIAIRNEIGRNAVRITPFAEPQPFRRIGLIWRSSANSRLRDFEALGDVIAASGRVLLSDPPVRADEEISSHHLPDPQLTDSKE